MAHLRPAVVVTGASRGIGLAMAQRFAKAGHGIVLVARHRDAVDAAAAVLSASHGVTVLPLTLNVCDADAAQMIETAMHGAGLYCEVLVNNAGTGLAGPFISHEPDAIKSLLDLNIGALTHLTRVFLPAMLARGHGGLLNIASLGGVVPGPNQAAYYASKAYVISLTEALAAEYAGHGVRIAVVVPGPVSTRFHAEMGADSSKYRWLIPQSSPDVVARSAYRGWRLGRRVIGPGLIATAGAYGLRVLPHALTVPMIRRLLAVPEGPPPARNRHG